MPFPCLDIPFFLSPLLAAGHSAVVKAILFTAALVAHSAVGAESWDKMYSTQGRLIVTQFSSAPFPHPSRAAGKTYKDEFYSAEKHYSDRTVALFIPKGFRETSRTDFVVHFHGWRSSVARTLQQFKLIEQLGASGKNAVLIVPEGPQDAPDSGGGKLEDPEGFKRFMAEVLVVLKQRGGFKQDFALGDIILSGHSGGYLVMSAILDRGGLTMHIKEVWLFDALYGQGDTFRAWSEQAGGRLINIYTDAGGTKVRTEELMAALKQQGTTLLARSDLAVEASELRTNKFIFLHTGLGHNEVLAERQTFCEFLRTSFLEDRKPE
jgi:hypothetical protein